MATPAVLVRLQKYLAEAGVASRRRCEQLIEAGQVSVNGQPSRVLGTKIDPERDSVTVGGKPVASSARLHCTPQTRRLRVHQFGYAWPQACGDLLPRSLPRLYTVGGSTRIPRACCS